MTYTPHDLAAILGQHPPTQEQSEIISAGLESGITIAGAGSGKTTVIGLRVLYLIANELVEPQQIIGLTFTNKAAGEMSHKISTNLARFRAHEHQQTHSASAPTIQTYNSYAAGLVAEYGAAIGIEPTMRVIDEASAIEIADRVVAAAPASTIPPDKTRATVVARLIHLAEQTNEHLRTSADIFDYLDACLERFYNPEFVEACIGALGRKRIDKELKRAKVDTLTRLLAPVADAPGYLWPAETRAGIAEVINQFGLCGPFTQIREKRGLAQLIDTFASAKRDHHAMQFSDQVAFAYQALVPTAVKNERSKWKVAFLDEYQDTSDSQVQLLRKIFAPLPVSAVGDPRQSIYAWRGASERNIEGFADDFAHPGAGAGDPGASGIATHSMTTSFRNCERVLAIANALASRLPEDSPETRLKPAPGAELGDVHVCVTQGEPHAEYVTDMLADLVEWMSERNGHRAVLVRKKEQFSDIAQALTAAGLPVQVVGKSAGLDDPFVADVYAAFNVVIDPQASTHLTRVLTNRMVRLGAADLHQFMQAVKRGNPADAPRPVTAVEFVDRFADDEVPHTRMSEVGVARMRSLARVLRQLRSETHSAVHVIRSVIRALNIPHELRALTPGQAEVHRAQLDAFISAVAAYEGGNPTASVTAVAAWLERVRETGDIDAPVEALDPEAITVMTVHASKGLEFDAVALPHLTMQDFPTQPRGYQGWLSHEELPYPLRGDADKLPDMDLARNDHTSNKEVAGIGQKVPLEEDIEDYAEEFLRTAGNYVRDMHIRHQLELYHRRQERRLAYVAVTRAKNYLWLGAAYHGHRQEANALSPFITEAVAALNAFNAARVPGEAELVLPEPADIEGEKDVIAVPWPVEDSAEVRAHRDAVVALVRDTAPTHLDAGVDTADEFGQLVARAATIVADAKRAAAGPELPQRMNATQVVAYRADPEQFMEDLRRPMPQAPNDMAALGTAFHAWVEMTYKQAALTGIEEAEQRRSLPARLRPRFDELCATFSASPYATRVPHAVELEFELPGEQFVTPGKIDAVFKDGNHVTVVDWKTGSKSGPEKLAHMSVQLEIYVEALKQMPEYAGCTFDAEFYFVGSNDTVPYRQKSNSTRYSAE